MKQSLEMFKLYVHGDSLPRDNVVFVTEPDDPDIDAWVCPKDHPDRELFDTCNQDLHLLFNSTDHAVQKLVLDEVEIVAMSEAWTRKAGKSESGGLNAAGRRSYNHNGKHLQKPVAKGKRHKSFCARMKGMKAKLTGSKTKHDPDSRINKSLRKWHC